MLKKVYGKMKIETKEVRKLNNSAGYIPMKADDIGKEYVVLTQKELDYLLGRKLE